MTIEQIIFYITSGLLIFAALSVITVRNPVHAALFLVLTFFASAIIWLLLQAEFLAVTLILVYVGAVMVLFLFVVMMLDINLSEIKKGFVRYLPIGIVVALVMAVEIFLVINHKTFDNQQVAVDSGKSNIYMVGDLLYNHYVYAFEVAAVILLVAIIAAIMLTLRKRPETKYQNPSQQIKVTKKDRLRVVSMETEVKE